MLVQNPVDADLGIAAAIEAQWGGFSLNVDLQLPGRGITALFGRSGSGKTSILRVIAGLQEARRARIRVGDCVWQDNAQGIFLPTHRRALGYVFQEASLFAHLSVRGNLEYGFKRTPLAERKLGFDQVVDLLGVEALLPRRPDKLSGGERQRVAMARALLASPRLLLMDEPLAALDGQSRAAILPWLERLHRELEIPVFYVSHALDEVARLADTLVLLEAGQVLASGPLAEVLTRLDLPTASGDEGGAVIDACVLGHDAHYGLSQVGFAGIGLWVGGVSRAVGEPVRARVLARDVSLAIAQPGASSILNVLAARVLEIRDEGTDKVNVRLAVGEPAVTLLARITRRSRDTLALQVDQQVFAQVKSVALLV